MAVREFLLIAQEAAYNTAASIVVGTNAIIVRLDQDNAFTMRPNPVRVVIPYGGGVAVAGAHVSDKTEVKGNLSIVLCASQASFLLGWAATPMNSGQTAPWTSTEPVGDLASCSVYHAIARSDASIDRSLYTGVKVASMKLASTSEAQTWRLDLGLQGSTLQSDPSAGTFAVPTDSEYATDFYLFSHLASGLTVVSSRTSILEASVNRTNKIDAQWFENKYANIIRYFGHDSTLDAKLLYKPSPDDRAAYETLAQETVTFELNNGTHTDTFTFQQANVLTAVDDDLPNDKIYTQKITGSFVHDYTNGDMAYAHT